MMKIITESYVEDITAVESYIHNLYEEHFASHFARVREMYDRMKSKISPISDSELEYILTVLPMELFACAESINAIRLNKEVVKLKNKEMQAKFKKEYAEILAHTLEVNGSKMSATAFNEEVKSRVAESMVEHELFLTIYDSLITRVENEMSFARELIMGAKKVWDSRRNSENSNPVSPVDISRNQYGTGNPPYPQMPGSYIG